MASAEDSYLRYYHTEDMLVREMPQFEASFEGYLQAAMFCAHLAAVHLHTYEEGHIARDVAMRYVALAAQCCNTEGLSKLAEVASQVTAIETSKLHYA